MNWQDSISMSLQSLVITGLTNNGPAVAPAAAISFMVEAAENTNQSRQDRTVKPAGMPFLRLAPDMSL